MIHLERQTRFGQLVVTSLRGAGVDGLFPEERALTERMGALRVATFAGGRRTIRHALRGIGVECGAIVATPRGAPALPQQVTGSLSHKDDVAVALVALRGGRENVGVDLESDEPLRVDIARRVCRPEELDVLAGFDGPDRDRRVRITFAVKEAIYKAIDPVVGRYVAFEEVSLRFAGEEGRVDATMHLTPGSATFEIEVAWERLVGPHGENMILAFARALPT